MSEQILQQGIEYATEAIRADNEGDYQRALNLYMKGMEYMLVHQKHVKSDMKREIIQERVASYMRRAEQLKEALQQKQVISTGGDKHGDKKDKAEDGAPVKAIEAIDLEVELKKIVGLTEVKSKIQSLEKMLRIDKRRQELGLDIKAAPPPHMAFYGNPGTGKTTIARLIAAVLNQLGFLKQGHLVEVQRSDLVAGYVGQTASKTRKVIEQAKGGVLFVDEAYRLLGKGSKNDFGPEAIEELMSVMTAGDPVMIFAGYEKDMSEFFQANEGLFRRVQRHFHFTDYSCSEIARITQLVTKGKGFRFEPRIDLRALTVMVATYTSPAQRAAFNAALAKRIFNLAKENLDMRLDIKASASDLMTFTEPDLVAAIQSIPEQKGKAAKKLSAPAVPAASSTPGLSTSLNDDSMMHGYLVVANEDLASQPLDTLNTITGPVRCSQKRLQYLRAHMHYVHRQTAENEEVQVQMGPQPRISDAGVIDGDVMLLLARDVASANAFVEADPFKINGVWSSVSITHLEDPNEIYSQHLRDDTTEAATATAPP